LDFLAGSDPKVVFAFWLGVGLVVVTVVMLAVILGMRQIALRRERIHAQAMARWSGIVAPTANPRAGGIPELRRRDLSGFLELWNGVHETLHGETTPHLAEVARLTGLEDHLHRILDGDSFLNRLNAVIALGHVKNERSFQRAAELMDDKSPIISLCAARAMMQIDSGRAVSLFVPRIVQRGDWSPGSVAALLQEADDPSLSQELIEVTLRATGDVAPRLIRFLAGVDKAAAGPIIREILATSSDGRMLSTCLQVISDPGLLDCVRPLLSHPRWHLRMQAAVTIGRLGGSGDEALLVPLLGDPQWWVRYRTAQALMRLASVGREGLRRIQAEQADRYARDIIEHVLAERTQPVAA
jgi:hypothetical protein